MPETLTTPIQPPTSERSKGIYRLDPPPLLTDNEKMVATLESFGLKVIKQTDPPSLPTRMNLGHVPEEEREETLHFLRQISRYPRMPQILYPGEEEIADQPLELETAERGKWKKLEGMVQAEIYFCHPFHSWEKGLVENTNRWIRQFIKKKTNLQLISKEELKAIEDWFNHTPRQCLDGRTPYEVMMRKEYGKMVESLEINLPTLRIWG